ncbi:hypothetical protein HanHA300_Chr03g0079871 [Helianthus annuus]|nr:hypothetical protein HanHA300_Chr03g0079871 [Helianthus annuus]KAJ0767046.1 hypothetical protein HanLR1_Chr03g0084551 [Helianthus annuus]
MKKFYRFRQEINNLKAENATLAKEKAAAEAAAKEAETHRAVEARIEVQARETILGDVNQRLEEAEMRARQVAEERDGLATSNAQLVDDRAWMREFGVANVANAILDAPENTTAVVNVIDRTREAGFKAGYNECLKYVNALSLKKFTDERCALRGIDTDATFTTVTEAYNNLILPALAQIVECLEADDYVDRLCAFF